LVSTLQLVRHTCVVPGNSRPSAAVSQPPSLSLSRSLLLNTANTHTHAQPTVATAHQ